MTNDPLAPTDIERAPDWPEPANREGYSVLFDTLERLIEKTNQLYGSDIQMPTVRVMNEEQVMHFTNVKEPDDFSLGVDWEHSEIIVGGPLLEKLTEEQLEAILAHEIGHNFDEHVEGLDPEALSRHNETRADVFSTGLVSKEQAIETLQSLEWVIGFDEHHPTTEQRVEAIENAPVPATSPLKMSP